MTTTCDQVTAELSELVDGDRDAIARHAEHLAGCDACRDARHDATQLAARVGGAGIDHIPPADLATRVLALLDGDRARTADMSATDLRGPDAAISRAATAVAGAAQAHAAPQPAAPRSVGAPSSSASAPAMVAAAPATVAAVPATVAAAADHAATVASATGDRDLLLAEPPAPLDRRAGQASRTAAPRAATQRGWHAQRHARAFPAQRGPRRSSAAVATGLAIAAGITVLIVQRSADHTTAVTAPEGPIGQLTGVERAAPGKDSGVMVRSGATWRALGQGEPVPAGAELRTDERTRAQLALSDGTRLVLDHQTAIAFAPDDARRIRLTGGRLAADLVQNGRPTAITTPTGRIDIAGHAASTTATGAQARRDATRGAANDGAARSDATGADRTDRDLTARFTVTATDALTSVQVLRDAVALVNLRGERDDVRAGEEGTIERGALSVAAAPGLAREAAWSELAAAPPDEVTSGLGALRAYKPGESRDRDWKLALARHDVKVRVVGPIARTEVTETFRNDSATALEGVYQFPLPPDAQIDGLALDIAGGFVDGAFVDKERGARIWRGVIDRATPRTAPRPSQEIIWVEGRWRDPALLDWKRGGRFELRVYPIPAHGARTIKLAYTQVVTPRGAWRQYSYPLPHSRDGSTVADQFTVDVELRGAEPGLVRTTGYDLVADPARRAVNGLALRQSGFVPRGDLVISYRAEAGDAELRAWTFTGGAAAAPDDKLAAKQRVGIDPRVVAAQRAIAADLRPTAVLALRPRLPRWRDGAPRDYLIAIDGSQSMVGERFTRATELAAAIVARMDRRDRFAVTVCDSECRAMAELRAPSAQATGDVQRWLAAQQPAGASDVVAALRAAAEQLGHADGREPWILYIGDGFATTGFRRIGDIERAVASPSGPRITTIGIGSDADAAVLQAAARRGGGSYLAWLPGQRITTAAAAALESTLGAALRDATVELPAGLGDVAPTVLPTLRAGDEVLIAARMAQDASVAGDVILRGRIAGQPFEHRYPLALTASSAAGNGFVPRLWATLAIAELERTGTASDRARLVALSQGYGVMSRETSLLVLESQAMFDAFGVDRHRPTVTWTGEDALDEVASSGAIALDPGDAGVQTNKDTEPDRRAAPPAAAHRPATTAPAPAMDKTADLGGARASRAEKKAKGRSDRDGPGAGWIQLRRVWVRVPSVTPYDAAHPAITKAIGDAQAALAAAPDSREKHRALVQALSYAGELDRARDVARRWLERDQLDPQALGYLADLLGRDGQRDLALRTLAGLVDLDPDRVALHERMVHAYEQVGRLSQACAHRIAIASLQPALPAAGAAALRCLRALGRTRDADLILRALPDDASRAAVEKAALVSPVAAPIAGDLVVKARWDAPTDLDITLVTPDGTRVSWMGGRTDVTTGDVTAADREQLAIRSLRRGNYLVEISRASPAIPSGTAIFGIPVPAPAPSAPVHGTLDVTALGSHRAIPFQLTGNRAVIGRVSVHLEERFEEIDGTPVQLYNGPDRRIIPDRR